jgi:pyruvate-formate lyase-activating enzyme
VLYHSPTMQLGLLITFRCNARCGHCCVDASPEQRAVMEEADICSYVSQAADLPEGLSALCLSGGEALLYEELVCRVLRFASTRTKKISLITNAFWAINRDAANRKLTKLRDHGLTTLVVSASPYHAKFVDQSRAHTALLASHALGIETHVKATAPVGGPSGDHALTQIGALPSDIHVQHMPFLPGGRASTLPESSFDVKPGIPTGPCPGSVLTIHPNGDTYFCCTPGSFTDSLRLGNAKTGSLAELVNAYYFRGVLSCLRRGGPSTFVPAIIAAGKGEKLKSGYAGVCHLCTSLLADPDTRSIAEEVGLDHERDVYRAIVSTTPDGVRELVRGR